MCLDGDDDRLAGEPRIQIILQVAVCQFAEFLGLVEVVAVGGVEAVAHVGDFAVFVGQDVGVWLVVRDRAVVVGVGLLARYEHHCGWDLNEESLEGGVGFVKRGLFLGGVAAPFLGVVELFLVELDGTEELEEGQEILAGSGGEPVEGVVDQVGVCVAVDLEADGDAFGGGDAVYVLDVWDAAANGEARDDWG
jgi:hypothetical protein